MFHDATTGTICLTLYDLAQRYVGISEIGGQLDNPLILAMLKLDNTWPDHDEVPWCSGFVNWLAWHLRLPRSKSLLARSWLGVGRPVALHEARPQNDVVVLKRGGGDQPGAEDTTAPGHVGMFAGTDVANVLILGGNQGNQVSIAPYPIERILGIRRLLG